MADTFKSRLDSAMEKKGIKTYADLASPANVNPNSISRWISAGEIPRSWCANCHGVRVEPDDWKPADPPKVWRLWRVVRIAEMVN